MDAFQSRYDRETNRVATFTGVMMFWAAVFVPVYLSMGGVKCAIVLVLGCAIALSILICLRLGVFTRACGNMLCGAAFFVYTMLSIFCGGRWAPTTIWYVSMPVLSMAVLGAGGARFWSLAGLFAIVVFTVLDYRGVQLPSELDPSQLILIHALGLAALLLCFYVLAYVMMRFEQRAKETLREANRWLQRESSSDALTNVANRRYFDRVIEQEWNLHLRDRLPLAVVLIDLDYFKEFNDHFGHLAGDRVLRLIAAAIQAGVRRGDVVARFGGEEFVVILPNSGELAVRDVAARIRREIDELNVDHPHSLVSRKVTISVGTTTVIPADDRTHLDLLRHADQSLYLAKSAGRDRVVHTTGLPLPTGPKADSAPACEAFPVGPDRTVRQVIMATIPADAFRATFGSMTEAGS